MIKAAEPAELAVFFGVFFFFSGARFSKSFGNFAGQESCFMFVELVFNIKVSIILKMIQ